MQYSRPKMKCETAIRLRQQSNTEVAQHLSEIYQDCTFSYCKTTKDLLKK